MTRAGIDERPDKTMNAESLDADPAGGGGLTRRTLLGAGLVGGAALAAGRLPSWLQSPAVAAPSRPWLEASIPELQALMASGELTSRQLTLGYLEAIASLNPLLGAVIETNPDAVAIASRRDRQRRSGHVRGPLHGIPVLVKDNIATDDRMQTTAGSLALVGSRVPRDAPIVGRLRAAGAVILGKANLSEWANFRGFAPFNGWSARGGFSYDPYLLSFDPCGSSSGSAIAPAANLCAAAIGTETNGSVVCPAGNNLVVGLKPSIGLLPQDGIIPIAHSQDTAGPMTRTVVDAAILLAVMQTRFRRGNHSSPLDHDASFRRRRGLRKVRIGVDRRYFTPEYGGEPHLVAVAEQGLEALVGLGATLVDTDTGDPLAYFDAEFTVLLVEFKAQIAEYLGGLRHTSMRTLSDLIAFNIAHCPEEMKYFGQEIFELSEATSGDLTDPDYRAARALCVRLARTEGIDAALRRDRLHAIVAPTYSFASSPAAVAGYPNISIPVGLTPEGKPAGLWMYSGFLRDWRLLRFAHELEQELRPRRTPQFLGSVPPEPPDAGICTVVTARLSARRGGRRLTHQPAGRRVTHHLGTGKPLNR
jgi:amidase